MEDRCSSVRCGMGILPMIAHGLEARATSPASRYPQTVLRSVGYLNMKEVQNPGQILV